VESDGDTTNTGSADIPLVSIENPRALPKSTAATNTSHAKITAVSENLRSVSIRGGEQGSMNRSVKVVQAEYGTTNYIVPAALEGTAKAIGKYDWKDYVKAAEEFVNGVIDEAKLNKIERTIFQVPSDKMRMKIRYGVIKMITDFRKENEDEDVIV
jgi:hypothetical protein